MLSYTDTHEGLTIHSQIDWTNLRVVASAYVDSTLVAKLPDFYEEDFVDSDFAKRNEFDIELLYNTCQNMRQRLIRKIAEKIDNR